jgi:YYY domain-containing protein
MAAVAGWWLAISLLGLLALPLTGWLFNRLPGRGLLFARPLGLLFTAYLLWAGVSLRLLPNDLRGDLIALLGLGGISLVILFRQGNALELWQAIRRERGKLLLSELIFAFGFLGWAALRAFTADKIQPSGGEKFMEMAFLNGILNSRTFPPSDPWLSGFSISYYYFGYVHMAILSRLTALSAGVAFELHDAMLFGLALQLPFALVSEMADLSRFGQRLRTLAGLASALFTAGTGNLEGLFESLYSRGWLPAWFTAWLGLPGFPPVSVPNPSFYPGYTSWWWWRASRVLADRDFTGQIIPANPITEFPFFSFLLGDNHPHVLALPFAFLAGALALDWAQRGSLRAENLRTSIPRLILSSLLLGSLLFLNTWDFPIYFGLALLAYLGGQFARQGRLLRSDWLEFLIRALFLGVCSGLLYLPFLLSFSSQASGILPYIFPPTRLAHYLVMFGQMIFILAVFFPAALTHNRHASAQPFSLRRVGQWWLRLAAALSAFFVLVLAMAGLVLVLDQLRGGLVLQTMQSWLGGGTIAEKLLRVLVARLANPWLFLLLSLLITLAAALAASTPREPNSPAEYSQETFTPSHSLDVGLFFSALLGLAGLALTFSVEFVYLRDGFGVRMNTVFKFYFQAWLLMACACGYAVGWLGKYARPSLRAPFFIPAGVLLLAGLVYPLMAIPARTHNFTLPPTLDGTSNLHAAYPDDWAAMDWLRQQAKLSGQIPVLLEAPCLAYCFEGRISAFTGFPTVLGWASHEAQWRDSIVEQSRRQEEIAAVYTAGDPQKILQILSARGVNYVILGKPERDYIAAQCSQRPIPCDPAHTLEQLDTVLTPVFQQGEIIIYLVPY